MSNLRTVGIVQDRMGSTRLPQKASLPLAGKPMCRNIMERLQRVISFDALVWAVPSTKEDLFIIKQAAELDINVFIGTEHDIVTRFYLCAELFQAELIVRICADNPMIEPEEVDRIIDYAERKRQPGMLYSNTHNINNNRYPDGLGAEVYTMSTLKWMYHNLKPQYREHPHKFFHENGLVETIKCPPEYAYPKLKLDIDTPEDYQYIKSIYDKIGSNEFHILDYIQEVI